MAEGTDGRRGPAGTWRNELGAEMTLEARADGRLTGTYRSPVGEAPGVFRLEGRFDPAPPEGGGAALGWSVVWSNEQGNAYSATSWCGRHDDAHGQLHTTWLLTAEGPEQSAWSSTRIGQDVFVRVPASAPV